MIVGMVLVVEGGYGGASAEALDVTTKEKSELFGGIGQVIYYIFSFELLAFKFSFKKKINMVFIQLYLVTRKILEQNRIEVLKVFMFYFFWFYGTRKQYILLGKLILIGLLFLFFW